MLRVTAVQLKYELGTRFGYDTPVLANGSPRDVIWCADSVAKRKRQEQSSILGRDPEQNLPFLSYYRTAVSVNKKRLNVTMVKNGVSYYRSPDGKEIRRYEMIPVDFAFQVEFWAGESQVLQWEAAIESYIKWAAPPQQFSLTDSEGVEFRLPIVFADPVDNSLMAEEYEAGKIYRETFSIVLMGWVVTGTSPFKTIESLNIAFWDVGGGEATDSDDILIKRVQE